MERIAEQEAFDRLPAAVRIALSDSVAGFDAREVEAYRHKHNDEQTLKWLRRRDQEFMRSGGFYLTRGCERVTFSSYVEAKVKPIRMLSRAAA